MSEVSLYIRIRTADGKQPYCRPVWLNKRQMKEGWAFVNGKPEHYPEGSYHLRYTVRGKQVWAKVGKDALKALVARDQREWVLNNTDPDATGVGATFWAAHPAKKIEPKPTKLMLAEQRDKFLQFKKTTKKKDGTPLDAETITAYEQQVGEFLSVCQHQYAAEVEGQDLRDYMAALRERGLSHRSVCNNYTSIVTFLKFVGVDHKNLLPYGERPSADDGTPEAYSEEDMRRFFATLTHERHRLAFEVLLKVGLREREMTTLEWGDLNMGKEPTVRVQARKPHLKFRVKTGKGRTVPLERNLALKLAEWHVKTPKTHLVFGTSSDLEDSHFWRTARETFERAGISPLPRRMIHKFRDTFGTWACRAGKVDLRTLQHWMGHSSITMTERYLAPQQGAAAQTGINQTFSITFDRELTAAVQ